MLKLHCDKDYPKAPPRVTFISKIIMEGVDARGSVQSSKFPYLATWNASKTMHGVLTELKVMIGRASRQQHPDGTNF